MAPFDHGGCWKVKKLQCQAVVLLWGWRKKLELWRIGVLRRIHMCNRLLLPVVLEESTAARIDGVVGSPMVRTSAAAVE